MPKKLKTIFVKHIPRYVDLTHFQALFNFRAMFEAHRKIVCYDFIKILTDDTQNYVQYLMNVSYLESSQLSKYFKNTKHGILI